MNPFQQYRHLIADNPCSACDGAGEDEQLIECTACDGLGVDTAHLALAHRYLQLADAAAVHDAVDQAVAAKLLAAVDALASACSLEAELAGTHSPALLVLEAARDQAAQTLSVLPVVTRRCTEDGDCAGFETGTTEFGPCVMSILVDGCPVGETYLGANGCWISYGPAGLSPGHSSREAAEAIQVRAYLNPRQRRQLRAEAEAIAAEAELKAKPEAVR